MTAAVSRPTPEFDVLVIGCGFAGIGAGIALKQQGFHHFAILEKADDLGGTWRDNHYPGIAVDIPSLTYSFSFEQNPGWSRLFAPGRELQAYAHHCADKYGLRPHLRFNHGVKKTVFDAARDSWEVHLDDGRVMTSRFVISATGFLTQPKTPDIPGIESFAGRLLHTARWDHALDLNGQRVAVIGTGATAVQVVPSIAPQVRQLHVFQRTPIWIFPKPDAAVPGPLQALYRRLPLTQGSARLATNLSTEMIMVLGVVYNKQMKPLIKAVESICRKHLEQQVQDPEIRRRLTPDYGFGCKRPSFSSEYLKTFNRANVELVTDGIARITPTGIVTRDGRERAVDVLVCATGFKVFEKGNTPTYEVWGSEGTELGAFWDEHRYQAYQGASIPGFPNYFIIMGPYATTGASWFSMIESQMAHIMRCLVQARKTGATRVEVRREVHEAYFRETLRRQQNTVFYNNHCGASHSYYFDKHGDAPFIRPSSGVELWLRSRYFPISNYAFR
jgi:cation diffusion facilitator CzcD-associated flavoprotein CzcO